ncbi:hypothetical protein NT03LS_3356, partial [Listeria seeligeri FSL N1-067]
KEPIASEYNYFKALKKTELDAQPSFILFTFNRSSIL